MKFCKKGNVRNLLVNSVLSTHPCLLQMEDLSSLQPVHPRQEPDGVRPDQPLQRRDWQGGARVRAGVRGVQSDAAITELRLEQREILS